MGLSYLWNSCVIIVTFFILCLSLTSVCATVRLRWGHRYFGYPMCASLLCGSCKSVTLSVLCVCRQVGWLVCLCALWFNLQLFVIMIVTSLKAGDNRSPQSLSQGCYYACVACMWPAFVWISTRNEWNAQNAIWSHAFGFAVSRNLITHVLTIPHVKLTQSRVME